MKIRRTMIQGVGLNACLLLMGCNPMHDQPKYEAYEGAALFSDNTAARSLVEGTVARGTEVTFPESIPVTQGMLYRGQERFDIYCSPCHNRTGDGDGMIVQRGFPPPPSFHSERLRTAPDRHFYDVMSQGFGTMYSYASRIPATDRWAIVAYIRALQLSQHATPDVVPQDVRLPQPEPGKEAS